MIEHTGLLHRGLRPGAIVLTAAGAHIAGLEEPGLQDRMAGGVLGRPTLETLWMRYLSPEAVRGLPLTPASNVFSLGTILYEAATGHRPFVGESDFDLLSRIVSLEPLPSPMLHNTAMDPRLSAVIERATAKAPGDRYPGPGALGQALAGLGPPGRWTLPVPLPALSEAEPEDPQSPQADAKPPAASERVVSIGAVQLVACAQPWEELTPIAPIEGHEARHCARCDRPVLRVRDSGDLHLLAGRRCAHYTPEAPRRPGDLAARLRGLFGDRRKG